MLQMNEDAHTSTRASVFRFGDSVGFTPLAARTSSGVLDRESQITEEKKETIHGETDKCIK